MAVPVKLEELSQHLESIPKEMWNHLFLFIPRIEEATSFGEWVKVGDFAHCTISNLVDEFATFTYKMGLIVDFDWTNWKEGACLIRDSKTDYVNFSPVMLVKLLTTIFRADRFIEGMLITAFEDGRILQILQGLKLHYGVKKE